MFSQSLYIVPITAGPRQQMNAVTHVFDASSVYGSSNAEQLNLRSLTDGRLKTQRVSGHILPPQDIEKCPAAQRQSNKCPFLGGDSRINTTRKSGLRVFILI